MKFEIYSDDLISPTIRWIDNFKIFAKINPLTVRSPFRSVNLNFSRYKTIRSLIKVQLFGL
jgi:hypothetical protein